MFSAAADMDLAETVALIHRHGGLAVPAHVNRPSFSVVSQLGLFPEGTPFDAVEVFVYGRFAGSEAEWARRGLPMLFSSDSHALEEIGAVRSRIRMDAPTFDELVLALRGAEERECATFPCTSWT
jgi:PHP family Zn ribbon phosphoesterase